MGVDKDVPAGPDGVPSSFFFEAHTGTPAWDTGAPQGVVRRLLDAKRLAGPVLDLGCGTGENSLLIAASGLDVVAVDLVPAAIEQARAKAAQRDAKHVEFRVADLLELAGSEQFATAIDMAVFHVFSDADRPRYADSVARVLEPNGTLFIVVFSENATGGGPRRITQAELHETFSEPLFRIDSIEEERYELAGQDERPAWLMQATRL